jgi:hypothetical protein
MTDTPKKIRPGEVEITLAGFPHPLRLVPSIDAARILSRRYGGLLKVVEKVGMFDIDTFGHIIAAGAVTASGGLTEKAIKRLPDLIFDTGMANLVQPLSAYVNALAMGGRPKEPDADDPPAEDDDPLAG